MAPIGTDKYSLTIDSNEKAKSFIDLLNPDEKKRIFEALKKEKEPIQEKIPCPFPDLKWYSSLWSTLTSEQQQDMLENFRISADGKIEVIKWWLKASLLTAEYNDKTVFKWEYLDKDGKNWMPLITYLTWEWAEKECKKQNKILLQGDNWISQTQPNLFISLFPWKDDNEKILNFVKLFELGEWGSLDTEENLRKYVNERWDIWISDKGDSTSPLRISWDDNWGMLSSSFEDYATPFIVFEKI